MEYKEEQLKAIMKLAEVKMPFDDFEDEVMLKIEQVEAEKKKLGRSRLYALAFFALGTVFGIGSNYLIANYVAGSDLSTSLKNYVEIGSWLLYVVFIILLSDKLWKLKGLQKAGIQ